MSSKSTTEKKSFKSVNVEDFDIAKFSIAPIEDFKTENPSVQFTDQQLVSIYYEHKLKEIYFRYVKVNFINNVLNILNKSYI